MLVCCFSVIWCRSRLIQFAFLLQKTAIFVSTPWEFTWYLFHANHAPKCTTLECGSDLIAQSRDVAGAEQQPRNGTSNSLADTLTPASWYPTQCLHNLALQISRRLYAIFRFNKAAAITEKKHQAPISPK